MAENVILTCPHCGNKTLMKLLNKYDKVTTVNMDYGEVAQFNDIFEFFECPVCKDYHLYHTHWNTEEGYHDGWDIYEDGRVLFPVTETVYLYRLPKNVKSAYESALKVRNIDYFACVMSLRRTLEMVCKDKGAVNGQLHHKLNQLQQQGILPPLMGDVSKVIKDFGNMAAHGDQVDFDRYVVDSMFRLTNKILEFVYILPREIETARQELADLTEDLSSH
ncbi:hypothetical protein J2Y03_001130 [Neobacillus niacini]|uniref:DUF4145 domain-containing protein n=1 Tax=Neobacillus niacini TaxID=86668 RepID=UPI00285DD579|nr:DUF4145 domain-containing protein [Neobacillus niacini]MDR7076127.1 hypothetical protein [Neobacillus niacini]